MLTIQCHNLFSLAALSILIFNGTKRLATAAPFPFPDSQFLVSLSETLLVDNSLTTNKQNQAINLFQHLNLTPEQKQKITQIHRKYQQKLRKKRHTLEVLQQQLSDMIVGNEAEERLRSKNQQLAKVRQELGSLRFESMLETRKTLTLYQRQKFRDLVQPQLEQ